MSSDRTMEDAWHYQVASAKARGVEIPTEIDAETEAILREILGDADVDDIKAKCAKASPP